MLQKIDPDLIVPDWGKSLNENPFNVMGWSNLEPGTQAGMFFQALSEKYGFSMDTPLNRLPKEALDVILYGSGGEPLNIHYTRPNGDSHTFSAPFEGVIPTTERRAAETQSDATKAYYDGLMSQTPCPDCRGSRYGKDASKIRCVTKSGEAYTLPEIMDMDVRTALSACKDWKLVSQRLNVLNSLGLGYLTLGEETPGLSGGEAQRLKLASEMGKAQSGSVFVFDEPTIGLHPLDVQTLLTVFQTLIESGATVIVIEHDLDVIRSADYILDMGPGGGEAGGRLVACGTPEQIKNAADSVTGKFI